MFPVAQFRSLDQERMAPSQTLSPDKPGDNVSGDDVLGDMPGRKPSSQEWRRAPLPRARNGGIVRAVSEKQDWRKRRRRFASGSVDGPVLAAGQNNMA